MAGKSRVTAGEEQRNALLTLAHSRDRGEADRARAILLTLSGWTSPRIAEAFGVREDTVRKHWLTVEWLPKYAPELNDIEMVWRDLKAHHLAHHTLADADVLDRAIHAAVADLNQERTLDPLVIQRISA